MAERYLRMCHNPACRALYDPQRLHIRETWEYSPDERCPWCGQDLKESARKLKGITESEEDGDAQ